MTDEAPTVRVMARANLTLEGGIRIDVYEVAVVPNTPETQACIAQELLVAEGPDGAFPDLGPIGPMQTPVWGCCGKRNTF